MNPLIKVFEIRVVAVPQSDDEPAGFVATNDELGLVVEADSLDQLTHKIQEVAFDLFELNVLPTLNIESDREVVPAFDLRHLLSGKDDGRLLQGSDRHIAA